MAAEAEADPADTLSAVVTTCKVLGIGAVALATLLAVAITQMRPVGRWGPRELYVAAVGLTYFVGGMSYLVLSIYLERRRRWAVTAGTVLAGLMVALMLADLIGFVVALNRGTLVLGPEAWRPMLSVLIGGALLLVSLRMIRGLGVVRRWMGAGCPPPPSRPGWVRPLPVPPAGSDPV